MEDTCAGGVARILMNSLADNSVLLFLSFCSVASTKALLGCVPNAGDVLFEETDDDWPAAESSAI
jgi:hypothetical protein